MANAIQFPYIVTNPALGASSSLPYLPCALIHQQNNVSVSGLVDSGAMAAIPGLEILPELTRVKSTTYRRWALSGNIRKSVKGLNRELLAQWSTCCLTKSVCNWDWFGRSKRFR